MTIEIASVGKHRSLLRKAELSLGDLQTDGGYMNPEQAKKFIQLVTKESQLLQLVMIHPMKSPVTELNLIKFGGRVLKPGVPGAELASGDRVKPTTSQVNLTAELFKAEIDLQDEVVEDNIEQGNFQSTVMALAAKAAALDIEDIIINGDVLSGDDTLAVMDGIRKKSTSYEHDFSSGPLAKDDLSDMLRLMPIRYRKLKSGMKYLTSHNAEQDYRNSLADRATGAGDAILLGDQPVSYGGIHVMPLDVWPEDLGGSSDQTDCILVPLKNIVVGFWRKIRIEVDRDVRAGKFVIVLTVRLAVEYVEEEASVKGTAIQL